MTEWLDISSSQTIVDYALLKSKVDGIIIKLGFTGYGSNKPAFSDGWKTHFNNLKDKGIDLGVYYFTIAYNEAMVDMETEWVIKQLKEAEKDGFRFTLPIFVDCEAQKNSVGWTSLSRERRSELMRRWMDNMRKAGYYTGIYAGVNTWKHNTILVTSMLDGYDKWMAQYNTVNQYVNPSTGAAGIPGIDYTAWQYTSKGIGASYGLKSGQVTDVSHCYVDYPAIIKNGGWNGFTKTEKEEPKETEENVIITIRTSNKTDKIVLNKGDILTIERG